MYFLFRFFFHFPFFTVICLSKICSALLLYYASTSFVVSRLQEMWNCICLQPLGSQSGWRFKCSTQWGWLREAENNTLLFFWRGPDMRRVWLQAVSQIQPRMCCKTVVKYIGLFYCLHHVTFFFLPFFSGKWSLWHTCCHFVCLSAVF